MTATATTTIQGVSVLSRQKKRGGTDRFELALSPTGIEVRRPGRPVQQLGWDRVSEWEIEERKGYLLLTLRGRGATTPLVVPGWSLDDLELLMREITRGPHHRYAKRGGPGRRQAQRRSGNRNRGEPPRRPSQRPRRRRPPHPHPHRLPQPRHHGPNDANGPRARSASVVRFQLGWKPVVTVVLLGVLAAAITLVLLQSAGVISWSFLGPVA